MILKMNQNTYRDIISYQDLTSRDFINTVFGEVGILKISEILTEMWLCSTNCVLIQDLGWTQLESTLKSL